MGPGNVDTQTLLRSLWPDLAAVQGRTPRMSTRRQRTLSGDFLSRENTSQFGRVYCFRFDRLLAGRG